MHPCQLKTNQHQFILLSFLILQLLALVLSCTGDPAMYTNAYRKQYHNNPSQSNIDSRSCSRRRAELYCRSLLASIHHQNGNQPPISCCCHSSLQLLTFRVLSITGEVLRRVSNHPTTATPSQNVGPQYHHHCFFSAVCLRVLSCTGEVLQLVSTHRITVTL